MPHAGAWFEQSQKCRWRVWAPGTRQVELLLTQDANSSPVRHLMVPEADGYFSLTLDNIPNGQRYLYSLDGADPRPDPASRWQPDGVHAPSAVWSAAEYQWQDHDWQGIALADLVIYELHVGTFTPEGTFEAVIPRLQSLRELGITAIEIMPVGQFPGEYGWGYDGAYWYAVQQSYGGPDGLQRLVDACHVAGLAVILDVIYNHLGPEGNYLSLFGPYFTESHGTPWGAAVNYDHDGNAGVRDFVLNNVRLWIRDFHVDGLRLDAVQEIYDDSRTHLLADISRVAEEEAARRGVPVHVIAETDQSDVRIVTPRDQDGYGIDATWNDDFHHCVHTLLTGEQNGYYRDYNDPVNQLAKVLNRAYIFNNEFSVVRGRNHGTDTAGYAGTHFVIAIQTHDQVGNRGLGERLHQLVTSPQQRLAAGLLLTAPFIPMLFMGEEYGEQRPFPFFCDFGDANLREAVRQGRRKEFAAFDWDHDIPDPTIRATRDAAVLSWSWPAGTPQAGLRNLYHDLLELRRERTAFHDYAHRHAVLRQTSAGTPLLILTRGPLNSADEQVRIAFHLGETPARVDEPDLADRPVWLGSEATQYGGSRSANDFGKDWSPFEFRVYGALM